MSLHSLEGHEGWKAYCERYDEIIRKQIEEKIFDEETTDKDRAKLVSARKLLKESYTPEKLRQGMLAQANTEILRMQNQKK